jgi:enoyl-CoA hydratase/carnithine racemase
MDQLGIETAGDQMEYLKEPRIHGSGIYVPQKAMIEGELSGVQSFLQDGIGFIELGRLHIQNLQQMQNSLSLQMLVNIQTAMNELKTKGAKTIVISSQGGGVFSAGADLNYAQSLMNLPENERNEKLREFIRIGKTTMQFIRDFGLPTIALIDGPAVGGGAEMSSACDYRIMVDEESYIAFPEVGLGLIPEWMGTEYFPSIVGKELAKAMICNVRNPLKALKLTARDAKEVGFAHAVVPRYELYSFLAEVVKGNVPEIDLSKKPARPQNFDKKDYSDSIRKKFDMVKGFRHRGGSITKRRIARVAERFINNSHDPAYALNHFKPEHEEKLGLAFYKVNKWQIQPLVSAAQSSFWAPKLEKLGIL